MFLKLFVQVCLRCAARLLMGRPSIDAPPVIDVHVHAMDESFPGGGPMCPNEAKFLASDPKTKEAPSGWDVGGMHAEAVSIR